MGTLSLSLSLSCITRVAPHCVNTLMILHVAHSKSWCPLVNTPSGGPGARVSSAPRRTLTEARALLSLSLSLPLSVIVTEGQNLVIVLFHPMVFVQLQHGDEKGSKKAKLRGLRRL